MELRELNRKMFSHFSLSKKCISYRKVLMPFMKTTLHQKLHNIVTNRFFDILLVLLIILTSISVGVQTYDIQPSTLRTLNILDTLVTTLFAIEILIRM